LFETGDSRKIAVALKARAVRRLDRMDAAADLAEVNIPGFNFHPLHGKPQRYSVHVNGPWTITFGWDGENAIDVDLEQYH
jgi:proteic killer suppression protein